MQDDPQGAVQAGRPHIKGVRIRTVNLIMLALSALLFAVFLYTTVQISREYNGTLQAMDNYMEWEGATRRIQYSSDYLSDMAKLYVTTHELQYANNYFTELYQTRGREKAMEALIERNLHTEHEEHDCGLQRAMDLSNALTFREIYVIRLVAEAAGQDLADFPDSVRDTRLHEADRLLTPEKKIARAREMMFNVSYQKDKEAILRTLSAFLEENVATLREALKNNARELGEALNIERIMLFILFCLNVMTFTMVIVLIVRPLKIYLKCIQNDKMLELVGAYEFKHLALTYNDIFTLKEHHDKMLKHQAEHDPLTGLYNRAAYDSLCDELAKNPKPMGLLLVDVDKFKEVNDTYGHIAGDKTLQRVAGLLQHNFRSDDYCLRLGGDEFAVIFNAPGSQAMESIVQEKIQAINQTLSLPGRDAPATSISVGGAISSPGFCKDLYRQADLALYEVKEAGRRGCRFYHPGTTQKTDA